MGNLVVEYNEEPRAGLEPGDRGGAHNLVISREHKFLSFGGFVAGFRNTISGPEASVSGGENNEASGLRASVTGGLRNEAKGEAASVSEGTLNTASENQASVSGGNNRTAEMIDDWAAGSLYEDN